MLTKDTAAQWMQTRGRPFIARFYAANGDFDAQIEPLLETAERLLSRCGVFQITIHFANSQLVCWFYQDPYRPVVYAGKEVLAGGFLQGFERAPLGDTAIPYPELRGVFQEFKRMRCADKKIYLQSASVNLVNGTIGLSFSYDGSCYLPYAEFRRVAASL